MKLKWTTEQRRICDLIPHQYNPRIRDEKGQEVLHESLETFGQVDLFVINLNNFIISGERRWEDYKESGKENELVEVRVPNRMLTEEEVKKYMLLANSHAGKWDLPKLETEFTGIYEGIIELPSINTDLVGTDMLDKKKVEQKEIVEDEFDEQVATEPITKYGDIYELNDHRIMCGDTTDILDMRKLMNKKTAGMIFTDPPYNVKVKDIGGLGKIKHKEFVMASGEMNPTQFRRFLEDVFHNCIKVSDNGSIHYICMDWKHVNEISEAGKIYNEFKNLIIWVKDNGGMGSFYRSKHELIFIFKSGKKKHINNFLLGQNGRYRTNVWTYAGMNSVGNKEREALEDHPTVKPVKLVADAIMDCSDPYMIILDGFLGSGTTMIAAEQTNRFCYGMEMEPRYMDTSIRRYIRFMKQIGKTFTIKRNGVLLTEEEIKSFENVH